jgi:hypothetical protein
MSAFVYNTAVVAFSSCIVVPAIVFSIVGAAQLIGRAGERLGLWGPRRP